MGRRRQCGDCQRSGVSAPLSDGVPSGNFLTLSLCSPAGSLRLALFPSRLRPILHNYPFGSRPCLTLQRRAVGAEFSGVGSGPEKPFHKALKAARRIFLPPKVFVERKIDDNACSKDKLASQGCRFQIQITPRYGVFEHWIETFVSNFDLIKILYSLPCELAEIFAQIASLMTAGCV